MLGWFRRHKFESRNYAEEKYWSRLVNAFPSVLKPDVEAAIRIIPLHIHDVKLCDGQFHYVDNLIHSSSQIIQHDGEILAIPCRLYFNEPAVEKESQLTNQQQIILNCIYLRHHDGYLRQRRLEKLLEQYEAWITPFTIQLLGEYVYEILLVLDKHIADKTINNYVRFINDNPKYWKQIESRMTSYWDIFHRRRFPKLKDYIGRIIVDRLKWGNRKH